MDRILDFIAKETDGKNFKSYKYCFEAVEIPKIEYEDKKGIHVKNKGETDRSLTTTKSIKDLADKISRTGKPLFKYFLDGSRRTYKVDIYSFPMKFHPINGEKWYANRHFIGRHWNKKFIRAIQTILNATKEKIGKGKSFFLEAFGNDEDEYFKLLYMPETYILFRFFFKDKGYTGNWWNEFNNFSSSDLLTVKSIIEKNDFSEIDSLQCSNEIRSFLKKHYLVYREDLKNPNSEIYREKEEYDKIKSKR